MPIKKGQISTYWVRISFFIRNSSFWILEEINTRTILGSIFSPFLQQNGVDILFLRQHYKTWGINWRSSYCSSRKSMLTRLSKMWWLNIYLKVKMWNISFLLITNWGKEFIWVWYEVGLTNVGTEIFLVAKMSPLKELGVVK